MSATRTDTQSTEIRHLIADMYDAFAIGDASSWADRLSQTHNPVGFGTDPHEFWSGNDQLSAVFNAQVQEMHANGVSFEGGEAQVETHGDVAWVTDQPTLRMGDSVAVPMRLSVVFVKEGSDWAMAQFHLSVGVANENLLNMTLTV